MKIQALNVIKYYKTIESGLDKVKAHPELLIDPDKVTGRSKWLFKRNLVFYDIHEDLGNLGKDATGTDRVESVVNYIKSYFDKYDFKLDNLLIPEVAYLGCYQKDGKTYHIYAVLTSKIKLLINRQVLDDIDALEALLVKYNFDIDKSKFHQFICDGDTPMILHRGDVDKSREVPLEDVFSETDLNKLVDICNQLYIVCTSVCLVE